MSSTSDIDTTATRIGGTRSDILVHRMGYGLMLLTWTPTPVPDEQAFEAIKTAIDLTPPDQKLFINSGEFYGFNPRTANLELVARFFTKYPELADRVFLSVKGGLKPDKLESDCTPTNLRRSVDTVLKALNGKKKLDLFQFGRADPNFSIEDIVGTLKELKDEGKFEHIGVSEVSANTLRRANAVAPIAAVEIEVSVWAYEEETKKVIATAQELGIPVIAYSPLGHGFLTGTVTKDDLHPGDLRRHKAKLQDEHWAQNKKVIDTLTTLAAKKGITTAQLSLAWVFALGPRIVPIPGTSKATRVQENFAAVDVKFSEEELKEIDDALKFVGPRGRGVAGELLWA